MLQGELMGSQPDTIGKNAAMPVESTASLRNSITAPSPAVGGREPSADARPALSRSATMFGRSPQVRHTYEPLHDQQWG